MFVAAGMRPRRGVAQTCAGTIGFSGAVSGLSAHFTAGSSQLMHCRSVRPEMVTTATIRFPHFGQRVSRSMRPSRIFTPNPELAFLFQSSVSRERILRIVLLSASLYRPYIGAQGT